MREFNKFCVGIAENDDRLPEMMILANSGTLTASSRAVCSTCLCRLSRRMTSASEHASAITQINCLIEEDKESDGKEKWKSKKVD